MLSYIASAVCNGCVGSNWINETCLQCLASTCKDIASVLRMEGEWPGLPVLRPCGWSSASFELCEDQCFPNLISSREFLQKEKRISFCRTQVVPELFPGTRKQAEILPVDFLAWFLRKQGLCKHTGVCASVCVWMYVSFLDALHLQKLLSSLADFKPTLLKLLKLQYSYRSPENRWSHKGCAVHSATDRKANRTTLSRLQEIQDTGYCASLFPQIMNLVVFPWSIIQQTLD